MDVRELKDSATDLFRKGKFAKSAEAYLSLTKAEPNELQHFIKLGDSYRRDGQKERAIEAYRVAVDGYARQGVMIKAIATCKLILEIDPAHKRAQEALAELCAKRYTKPELPRGPIPSRKHVPEVVEIDETGDEELVLDDGRVLDKDGEKKKAEAEKSGRTLPPIKKDRPAERSMPPAAPPVMAKKQVEAIDLPEEEPAPAPPPLVEPEGPDSIELDLDMGPAPAAKPPPPPRKAPPPKPPPAPEPEEVPSDEIEIDLGPPQPKKTPAKAAPPAIEIEVGAPDEDVESLEVIDVEEVSLESVAAAEEALLKSADKASKAPTTEMADILAARTDASDDDIDLFPGSTGDTGRITKSPGKPDALTDLYNATATPTRRPTAEDLEVAALTEEAAFDLVPTQAEAEAAAPEPPPPPPAIPSADLTQEDVPLFSGLPNEAFIDLLELLTFRRVAQGESVIREGDIGKSIYILASGHARVVKGLGAERPIELATLDEGAFFGEMALLNGAPRVASVVASTDSEVLELTEQILRDLTKKHPSVGESLKQFYRQRLLANVMAISPLFRAFDKADKKSLVEKFKLREAQNGEQVIKEGQSPDGLYVVMHGAALVTKNDAQRAKDVPLALLKEGDVFGEMSLLTKRPANATITAKRRTLLLRLPKASFDELMFTHPAILEVVSELSDERTRANAEILSGNRDAPREALAFL